MSDLSRALETCLEQMDQDGLSLQHCLDQYPELADELEPLILAAQELEQAEAIAPNPSARARMKARLSQHMQANPVNPSAFSLTRLLFGNRLRFALAAMSAIILSLGTLTWVAQASVPGDVLYPYKRATERIGLTLIDRPTEERIWLAERRMDEWIRLRQVPALADRAKNNYRQALDELVGQVATQNIEMVTQALANQQARLSAAGLSEPKLNRLQEALQPGYTPPADEAIEEALTPTLSEVPQLEIQVTMEADLEDLVPTLPESDTLP